MKKHERFAWNRAKSDANLAKHGISFDDAADLLNDPWAYRGYRPDEEHSTPDEDHWQTLVWLPNGKYFVIVWCERERDGQSYTRIITAYQPTKAHLKEFHHA